MGWNRGRWKCWRSIEINEDQIEGYLPAILARLEEFDREELIKRFVSSEFNRFLNYYKDAKDGINNKMAKLTISNNINDITNNSINSINSNNSAYIIKSNLKKQKLL
jgi:hypothetical protein